MSIFKITYYLINACLGEISPNFRRVYWVLEDLTVKVYFYLKDDSVDDIESIEEIISLFYSTIEQEEYDKNYTVIYEVIYGQNNYLKRDSLDYSAEVFRMKE